MEMPADGVDWERSRLAGLRALHILDTQPEAPFDRITALACSIYSAPIALVSLVDENRQWFKSRCGLDVEQTPRKVSFCSDAIRQNRPFIIRDTLVDPRYRDNPLVTGPPNIRFYAGAPLAARNGLNVGTLCIIDKQPRPHFSVADAEVLTRLADIVLDEMDLRIANAEIDRARKLAQAASQEKADFLANTSHEIRTPLNAIMSLTELALAEAGTDETRTYLEKIQEVNGVLLRLIEDVLDISQIEARRLTLDPRPFDPRVLAQTAISLVERQATEKPIVLDAVVDDTVPKSLLGDSTRLLQVVVNLLGNAMKFTEEGTVTLSLKTLSAEPTHVSVRFAVRDTGQGIPESAVESIFHRFDQVMDPNRRSVGTGLGLAISRALVTLMGSDLEVASRSGAGSEFAFSVRLPRIDDVITTEPLAVKPSDDENLEGFLVVLVDDDDISRDATAQLLQRAGADVIEVGDGEAAIETVVSRGGNMTVVLMDVELPKLSGLDATREIRKLYSQSDLPIIALTGRAIREDRIACLDAGMNEFLSKPVSFATMAATIRRCCVGDAATDVPPVMENRPTWNDASDRNAPIVTDLDPELLETLLQRFNERYASADREVRDVMAKGALDTAASNVHALCGAAAMLGLMPLSQAARDLETALRARASDRYETCLTVFETALRNVVDP